MLLNAIGLLLFLSGSCLLALGGTAVALSIQARGDVMWIFGLTGSQTILVGLGCLIGAAGFFALEGIRKRLVRIEAKLRSVAAPQEQIETFA